MLSKKQGAAVGATAHNIKDQVELYRNDIIRSSTNFKNDIGELLWSLQFSVGDELEQIGWGLFEHKLREYADLIHTGGTV